MKRMLIMLLTVIFLIPCAHAEAEFDVTAAVDALKVCWRDEVYGSMEEREGYLEIKNTRVVVISDAPTAGDENASRYAEEYFGDVAYIVEFMLYSDLMGAAPYYQNADAWDCVVVYKDGSAEVAANNPFEAYRARTYSNDISGIVQDVIDLNQQYNGAFRLLEE